MTDEAFEKTRIAYWHGAKQKYPTPNDRLKAAIDAWEKHRPKSESEKHYEKCLESIAEYWEQHEAKPDKVQEQQSAYSNAAQTLGQSISASLSDMSRTRHNSSLWDGRGWPQESRPCSPALPRTPLSWFRSYRRRRSEQKAMAREIFIGR